VAAVSPEEFLVFTVWNGGDLIIKSEAAKRLWMGVLVGVGDVVAVRLVKYSLSKSKRATPVSPEQRKIRFAGDRTQYRLGCGEELGRYQKGSCHRGVGIEVCNLRQTDK
jgi:hypothetical protein